MSNWEIEKQVQKNEDYEPQGNAKLTTISTCAQTHKTRALQTEQTNHELQHTAVVLIKANSNENIIVSLLSPSSKQQQQQKCSEYAKNWGRPSSTSHQFNATYHFTAMNVYLRSRERERLHKLFVRQNFSSFVFRFGAVFFSLFNLSFFSLHWTLRSLSRSFSSFCHYPLRFGFCQSHGICFPKHISHGKYFTQEKTYRCVHITTINCALCSKHMYANAEWEWM